MKRHLFNILMVLVLMLSLSPAALAQNETPLRPGDLDRPLPASLAELKLETAALQTEAAAPVKLAQPLIGIEGPQQVIVKLKASSVAERVVDFNISASQQRAALKEIKNQQGKFIIAARSIDPGLKVMGATQRVLNAVILQFDGTRLAVLAQHPSVKTIRPVVDYELDLTETVPYIGATAVQDLGFTGAGIKVGVIDSGVDYTHAAFGGPGDPAVFAANDPTIIEPGTFPTAKVVGGYDFVGGNWVAGAPLEPDPDPLDDGPGGGHGTHVAHIIGGLAYEADGLEVGSGVAPGVDLYALKVCSSITTSCSGTAMLQALDWATDPNGDGVLSDRLHVVNMSIGSPYGQGFDDDTSQATEIAVRLGVLVVASAGNSADKPFITGTPGGSFSALSVAQTSVPSAFQPLMEVVSPPAIAGLYPAIWQPWSAPLTAVIQAPAQYGNGAGGNLNGCAAFPAGSLAGKIVLVDRGACNFSAKIKNIGDAGGLVGIIGLIAPGEPFEGGFGGESPITIPGYMISQADSNRIKSQLAAGVVIKFDPNVGIPLVKHMVGSSSRGPSSWINPVRPDLSNMIKPEIGAPGASISAVAGSGTGVGAFGGTSGAAPMVAGSAALLMDAYPGRQPLEIKAVLVNSAETDIMNRPAFFGGGLAPITRIGGGEVRVDRALASPAAAWMAVTPREFSPAVSFGLVDVVKPAEVILRTLVVRNYSAQPINYRLSYNFRFQNDADNGAVMLGFCAGPGNCNNPTPTRDITVPAGSDVRVPVRLGIDAAKLRLWGMNSGARGANGDVLTTYEYDGFIWLDNLGTTADDAQMLHLPWQVLPRLSANVVAHSSTVAITSEFMGFPAGSTNLMNLGAGPAYVDSYSWIGTSADLPAGGWGQQTPVIDLKEVGVATFPVPAGFCGPSASFVMSFVVNTWERQAHANVPALFEFDLDTDQDGDVDFAVFNYDLAYPAVSDGRNVTWVLNVATGTASAFFFTDHATNSANTILTFCGDQLGMTAANFFQPMDVLVFAVDYWFTGLVTDYLDGITISPLGERYLGYLDDFGFGDLASGAMKPLTVIDFGEDGTNPGEKGVLLVLDAVRSGVKSGAPLGNEALPLEVVYP